MKKDFDIEDTWIPHEIHPETPAEGRASTELFNQFDIDQVVTTCRQRGEPYNLEFGNMAWLSNTRLSLEAAEFARDMGRYEEFHHNVFKAYFSENRDIGDMAVLLDVAQKSGLNSEKLKLVLDEKRYADRVKEGSETARTDGVTAIPAFFIEGGETITGAVSEERFREVLKSVAEG